MKCITTFLLYFSFLFLLSSCGHNGISWNPDFYATDYEAGGIVSETGDFVSAVEPRFNGFACLSKQKIDELAEILVKAEIPRNQRKSILKKIQKSLWYKQLQ